jgi:hypothetical protein
MAWEMDSILKNNALSNPKNVHNYFYIEMT